MCVVSMVGDHYRDIWTDKPWAKPMEPFKVYPNGWPFNEDPPPLPGAKPRKSNKTLPANYITQEQFDELKRQVEEMKALLIRAKEYDERNNEPHCEMEDKVALLKRVAEAVGVSLEDVFGK